MPEKSHRFTSTEIRLIVETQWNAFEKLGLPFHRFLIAIVHGTHTHTVQLEIFSGKSTGRRKGEARKSQKKSQTENRMPMRSKTIINQ